MFVKNTGHPTCPQNDELFAPIKMQIPLTDDLVELEEM